MGEDLIPAGDPERTQSALVAAGARVDETSLVFSDPDSVTWEQLEDMAKYFLAPIGRGYPWWVGDMLNMAEARFGEEAYQLEAYLPNSPQTCANYKSVSKHVPRSRRRGLHLSVAEPVAYMEPQKRDELIKQAAAEGWKREEMREAARAVKLGLPPGGDIGPPPTRRCPTCGHALEDS